MCCVYERPKLHQHKTFFYSTNFARFGQWEYMAVSGQTIFDAIPTQHKKMYEYLLKAVI